MIFCKLKDKPGRGLIKGQCANCKADVYEYLCTLDDAYNVWSGACPHCKAINLLSVNHGLRGYSSQGMHLVLPNDEEKAANNIPADCPTTGASGKAPTMHGSPLGEILHHLRGEYA